MSGERASGGERGRWSSKWQHPKSGPFRQPEADGDPCAARRDALQRLRHGRRQVTAALDLPPLVIKLLANPLVQDYLRRTVLRTVGRKLGR